MAPLTTFRYLILSYTLSTLMLLFTATAYAGSYTTTGSLCGGLPQVAVETMDGTCMGLVIQSGPDAKLKKPRKIIQVPGKDAFLITDMGGWKKGRGVMWLLKRSGDSYAATKLKEKLNLPHQIVIGPDKRFYLGEAHRIVAFNLSLKDGIADWQTVIDDLPNKKGHRHPLSHFIFLASGDLLLNIGTPGDQCLNEVSTGKCTTRDSFALLRIYRYDKDKASWSDDYEIFAKGLRNSMALAVHPTGTILQAENNMDFDTDKEPYEEINLLEKGRDYGWPYCYDFDATHPKWKKRKDAASCKDSAYTGSWTLMPPHAAPLDMIYYSGDAIPALKEKLLISWHGYRSMGNRLVAYEIDKFGMPLRGKAATYRTNPKKGEDKFRTLPFSPDKSLEVLDDLFSQHIEVTTRWNKVDGLRPRGAPAGLIEAEDGSIFIVDDRNKAVLRLTGGKAWRDVGAVKSP
jgi:hypothetical protein